MIATMPTPVGPAITHNELTAMEVKRVLDEVHWQERVVAPLLRGSN